MANPNDTDGGQPRKALGGEAPGSYEVLVRVLRSTVDPGDKIDIQLFITGYGNIGGIKIFFYPPPDFITEIGSEISGFLVAPNSQTKIDFKDGFSARLDGNSARMGFGDVSTESEFDRIVGLIHAENQVRDVPPFWLKLQTLKSARSGTHRLSLCATYFNVDEWKSSKQDIEIDVPSWFKRHEALTWAIGSILGIMALVPWNLVLTIIQN